MRFLHENYASARPFNIQQCCSEREAPTDDSKKSTTKVEARPFKGGAGCRGRSSSAGTRPS
jgi:hypothetical protein